MADPLSLAGTIIGLVAHCATAARSLKELREKYTGAPAAVLMLSVECTTTSAVLERLKDLMQRNPQLLQPTRTGGQDLYGSFSTLVQEIAETVKLVLYEIRRCSGSSKPGPPDMTASNKAKFIWNEGFFADSLQSIRSLRSSMVLMLECLQMTGAVTASPLSRARVKISLRQESDEPVIQMILSKARQVKGRSLKNSPKHAIKLHDAIDSLKSKEVSRFLADRYDPNMRLDSTGLSPLHRALRTSASTTKEISQRLLIIDDDEALVRLACEFGSPVNAQDARMRTALHFVSPHPRRAPLIRILVAHGADVNLKQKDGQSPLYWAADEGNEAAVTKLLEFGANPDEVAGQRPNHSTTLIRAVYNKNVEIVKMLCGRGVPLDAIEELHPPLTHAVFAASVDVVQVLLDAGADINRNSVKGNPPILNAASLGNPEMVKYLIKRGANVNRTGCDRFTAVHHALKEQSQEALTILLEAGAQVDSLDKPGYTPLRIAIEEGFISAARTLVTFGAYVDYEDEEGIGYLDRAITKRQMESVKFLISSGVDITRCRRGKLAGMTALHIAACEGLDEAVTYLLDHGADIHATVDYLGFTPLHEAVANGSLSTVRLLVDRGASLDILSAHNANLLETAVRHPAMLTYLLNVGKLDPNHRDSMGATALSAAAHLGLVVSTRILLQRGAKQYYTTEFYDNLEDYLTKKNSSKGTPADLARQQGHTEVAKLIDEWVY